MRRTPHATLVLVLCCLAQFMVILDVSIVNVALPSIRGDLHFTAVELQWIVNAYTLTFAGFLLLGGRAADILGRREVFAAGLLLFAGASLLGGMAESRGMLVGARAAQGLGGAVVAPATLSILMTTFTEGAERNRALGLWGAMGGVGGTTGALLGGVLTEALSWRWILFINVPIGIVGAIAALQVVPRMARDRGQRRSFDVAGALTVTAGLVVLTYAIVGTEEHGWGSARTLLVAGLGLLLLAVFLVIETRVADRPLVPMRIFASRALSGANVVVLCMGGASFAMWYFVSLYLQQVLGFSPIEAGLAFLPMTGSIVVCSQIASRLTNRLGPGPVLAGGMALIGSGMLLFTAISADGSYLADVLVPSVLCAAGIGFSFVPVTIAATTGVAGPEAGLASGLVNTSRQIGGSLGLALLATIATQRTADAGTGIVALNEGFQDAFAVGAGIAGIGVLLCALLLVRGVAAPTRQPLPAAASPDRR
jgi:EmrB/QacA subfamily drug resistance transporter